MSYGLVARDKFIDLTPNERNRWDGFFVSRGERASPGCSRKGDILLDGSSICLKP